MRIGGLAQVLGAVLKLTFPKHDGCHLHQSGVVLTQVEEGQPCVRLHAALKVAVQDAAPLRDIWKCKGDAGTRMCMLCLAVAPHADLSDHDESLRSNILRDGELQMCTDADVIDAVQRLD